MWDKRVNNDIDSTELFLNKMYITQMIPLVIQKNIVSEHKRATYFLIKK